MTEQSYATHRKFVPLYHYILVGLLILNLVWALVRLFRPLEGVPLPDQIWAVVMAGVLGVIAYLVRTFPLRAQDRVIRLEERLRYDALLPVELKARTGELKRVQILALRFASDAELADLVRGVLEGRLAQPNEIKKSIRGWRADHFRL